MVATSTICNVNNNIMMIKSNINSNKRKNVHQKSFKRIRFKRQKRRLSTINELSQEDNIKNTNNNFINSRKRFKKSNSFKVNKFIKKRPSKTMTKMTTKTTTTPKQKVKSFKSSKSKSSISKALDISDIIAIFKDEQSLHSTTNNYSTSQSKECRHIICNENEMIDPPKISDPPKKRKRRKSQLEIEIEQDQVHRAEQIIFEENRKKQIAKCMKEMLDINNVKNCIEGKDKLSLKHRIQRNRMSSWTINIDEYIINGKKHKNDMIIGIRITDKKGSNTIYANDKGKIFINRKEIENGLKIEKEMKIVISVDYEDNDDMEQVVVRFSYLRGQEIYREESEKIKIDGIKGYKFGLCVQVFVAQNDGAFGRYTISKN